MEGIGGIKGGGIMFQLGTVSEGTLRTEDLLPVFANIIKSLSDEPHFEQLAWLAIEVPDDDTVDALIDALNELCPPFVYFGAHPGDGADFGFWPDHDGLQDALRTSTDSYCFDCHHWPEEHGTGFHAEICDCPEYCADSEEQYLPEDNLIVHVNDHGNVTVMDMDRNELWSCV